MEPCDVIVVGAGVAGLTLALSCRRQGLDVVVLERDRSRSYRRQGYFLMLPGACIEAIKESSGIDPEETKPECLLDIDREGKMPLLTDVRPSDPRFGTMGAVPRGPLRERMLDACAARGVEVRFDAEVVGIDDAGSDDTACTVRLSSGAQVRGFCVAGCDGVHSRVRRWLDPKASEQSCGSVCVRGFAIDDGAIRSLAGQATSERNATIGGVATPPGLGMNMTLLGGKITWVVELRHAAPRTLDLPGARQAVAEATQGFHPILRKLLLRDTADKALYVEVLEDLGQWAGPFGRGAVTLLGDAAHPSVWFGGGGRGIIDAVALAKALGPPPLRRDGLLERLREAEAAMQSRNPAEDSARKMRDMLPSSLSAWRETQWRGSEAKRLARWQAQQTKKAQAKL